MTESRRQHGSTSLALGCLDAVGKVARDDTRDPAAAVLEICESFRELPQSRAALGLVVAACRSAATRLRDSGNDTETRQILVECAELYSRYVLRARASTAVYARDALDGVGTVLTLCRSSTVAEALIASFRMRGVPKAVYVLETRPGLEGWAMAGELHRSDLEVTVAVDSAVSHLIKKVDLVLIGADLVTADGCVLNRVGTSVACQLAHASSVAVMALAPSYVASSVLAEGVTIDDRGRAEVLRAGLVERATGLRVENPADDLVPPELVGRVATDDGVMETRDMPAPALAMQGRVWASLDTLISKSGSGK